MFPGAGRGLVDRDYTRSLVGSLCKTGDGLDVWQYYIKLIDRDYTRSLVGSLCKTGDGLDVWQYYIKLIDRDYTRSLVGSLCKTWRWARRLTILYKINNGLAPSYLSNHIPQRNEISVNPRNRVLPSSELIGLKTVFIRILSKDGEIQVMILNPIALFKVSKKPLVIPFLEYLTNMRQNYSPKSELAFQIYATISTVTTLTAHNITKITIIFYVKGDSCGIEVETSVHFFLRCPRYVTQRSSLLSKIYVIISSDVTVFPNEHLYHILVYGSNVYNPVSNGLIITETITYIRNSGTWKPSDRLILSPPPPQQCIPSFFLMLYFGFFCIMFLMVCILYVRFLWLCAHNRRKWIFVGCEYFFLQSLVLGKPLMQSMCGT